MIKAFLEDTSEKNQVKKSLYRLVHKEQSISKVDLLSQFHVPNTTLTRMVNELENKGLIQQCGFGQPSGGRPPVLYEVVPSAGYLIGVDVSRTHVGMMLLDLNYQIVAEEQFSLTEMHTPDVTMKQMIAGMERLLEQKNMEVLLGIGVGSVGPIDRENGVILDPDSFPAEGWRNVPIVAMLKEKFSVPVVLNNGANTAALAEYYVQSLENESLLYCISGYGIRCGYIQAGKLVNSKQGDSSSYGHTIIEVNGRMCTCGRKGCLSSYVSFGAIFERLKENGISVTLDQLQQNSHPKVKEILLETASYYGIGISNMINILHPSVVILHGKLIHDHPSYYEEVIRVALENTRNKNVIIQKGTLGEKATAMGAAIQAFDCFF